MANFNQHMNVNTLKSCEYRMKMVELNHSNYGNVHFCDSFISREIEFLSVILQYNINNTVQH